VDNHTATHCNTLQHTAIHCCSLRQERKVWIITLQHTATHCNTLQHTATHCCSLRQERKVWIITLQHTATHCNTLQHTATHCNTLLQSTPGAKSEDNRKDPRICTLLAGNSAYFRRILRCSQYIHTLHSWLNR